MKIRQQSCISFFVLAPAFLILGCDPNYSKLFLVPSEIAPNVIASSSTRNRLFAICQKYSGKQDSTSADKKEIFYCTSMVDPQNKSNKFGYFVLSLDSVGVRLKVGNGLINHQTPFVESIKGDINSLLDSIRIQPEIM